MRKKLMALGFLFALLFISFEPAFAHGDITQAIPAADSTVASMPTEISIVFDGKLQTIANAQVNSITVTDNQGQIISNQLSVIDGTKISNRLLLTDVTGLVSVHYRIVSEDGHPVEGDYSFTVGETPMLTSAVIEKTSVEIPRWYEGKGKSLATAVGIVVFGLALVILRRIKK